MKILESLRQSLARADAVQSMEAARADSTVRVREAEGAAHRFASLVEQYRHEPEQTRIDLYRGHVGNLLRRTEREATRERKSNIAGQLRATGRSYLPTPPESVPRRNGA